MPASGPSDAGNSTVQSTPVSILRSSTLFSSSPTATPTSNSTTAVPTSGGPSSASQSAHTASSSTSAANHAAPSSVSSPVAPATSTTDTSSAQQEYSASQPATSSGDPSLAASTKMLSSTSPATTTSLSTISAQRDSLTLLGGTTSTFPPQSESTIPVSSVVPSAYSPAPASSPEPTTSDANSNAEHHGMNTLTPPSASVPITGVPMFTPTPVSSIVVGATVSTQSYIRVFTKSPNPPQQFVSTSPDLVTVVSMATYSGTIFQTTLTLESLGPGSLVPVPTPSSNVPLSRSSNSHSFLPLILGLVLGVLGIVALGVILFRCRARRRSRYRSNALLYDYQTPPEEKDKMMTEDTPHIISYRSSSTIAPERIATWTSPVDESFQSSGGQLSDPFADSSTILSSRTSMPPGSTRSVDSISTNMEFVTSVNTDTQDTGDIGRLTDESASLELQFAAPPGRDSWTRSSYLPSTWQYDGQSVRSSLGEERWNEERGDTSHTAPPGPPRPFFLGAENARLHLHALLKEARRV